MELHELKASLASQITQGTLIHATISNPRQKSNDLRRIKVKPILLRDTVMMQVEFQFERVMKHENILIDDFVGRLDDWFTEFRQFLFRFEEEEWQFQLSKKLKVAIKTSKKEPMKALLSHDRKKTYLLEDGVPVPFLIRLGVMTEAGQVKKQKYDKFKQINRFLEFVEDSIAALPKGKNSGSWTSDAGNRI